MTSKELANDTKLGSRETLQMYEVSWDPLKLDLFGN